MQNENYTREDAMLAFSFLHSMNMDQLKVLAKEWDVVKKGKKERSGSAHDAPCSFGYQDR